MPTVCPVTGGGYSLTWQRSERGLEIEILPDGTAEYLATKTDPISGVESSQEGLLSLDQAPDLATWLIDE
jgi:hypothetical protein